jgi:hypothetical protein
VESINVTIDESNGERRRKEEKNQRNRSMKKKN